MQHPYVVVAPAETVHVEAWPGNGPTGGGHPGLFGAAFAFRKVTPLLVAQGLPPDRDRAAGHRVVQSP